MLILMVEGKKWWFKEHRGGTSIERNGEICGRAIKEKICDKKEMIEDNVC